MQINIGTKIKELRMRDGRTQDALANAVGVTAQAVSRWEAMGGYPDMEIIPAIANYFHVTIDELFGYNEDRMKKLDDIIKKAESEINACSDMEECVSMLWAAADEFPNEPKVFVNLGFALLQQGWKNTAQEATPRTAQIIIILIRNIILKIHIGSRCLG